MDLDDSFHEVKLNRTLSAPINSWYYIAIDYKSAEDELTTYFYKAMLKIVVENMEGMVADSADSIPSGDRNFKRSGKYEQKCDDEELMMKDYENANYNNMESSTSLGHIPSKRRTTSISKRFGKPRRKSFKSRKKLTSSSTTTPKCSSQIAPSQHLQDQMYEECITMKFRNGNSYTGPTCKMLFHGIGEYRWSDGTVYKGDFCQGEIIGNGKFTYSNFSSYEGMVYNTYRHGSGKYFHRHSTVAYSGDWNLGKKEGTGFIHFAPDSWYDGSWTDNYMQGAGTRFYPSGSKYQGDFFKGKRHGKGCTLFWNDDFHIGEWCEGKRSGHGQYLWKPYHHFSFCIPAQSSYTGMWQENYMHGKGELNCGTRNGTRYIGQFCCNKKHGPGLMICDNGMVFDCSPLFIDNKPVQYSDRGEPQTSECNDSDLASRTPVSKKSRIWLPEHDAITDRMPRKTIEIKRTKKDFNIETEIFHFPNNVLEKEARETISLYKRQFHDKFERMQPIQIPMWVPAEEIDLNPLLRKLLDMIQGCTPIDESESFTDAPNTWQVLGIQIISKKHFHYDYQQIYNIEEKALRRAISINLGRIKEIYKQYSLVGCLKTVPYDTLMNRLFLWQMYRDCKISEKGISISCIDTLLDEDTVTLSENKSIHDPFEHIYFWQFLTSLLRTSWEIYGNKTFKYVFEGRSILEQIFSKFLKEDIFPHVGHHIGNALFDYKDIIPIKAAHNWYKSIEEPMSVKTFVVSIFAVYKKKIYCYEPVQKNNFVQNGANITIGSNVVFLAEEEPKYCIGPRKEKVLPFARKCDKKKLYFLHELGTKIIYRKIRAVVPGIFINKECFNHDYKLCFLEFYEIVLLCTQHILRRKELKFKKNKAKISQLNETGLLKIVTTKKSKAYRKSASSHHSISKRSGT